MLNTCCNWANAFSNLICTRVTVLVPIQVTQYLLIEAGDIYITDLANIILQIISHIPLLNWYTMNKVSWLLITDLFARLKDASSGYSVYYPSRRLIFTFRKINPILELKPNPDIFPGSFRLNWNVTITINTCFQNKLISCQSNQFKANFPCKIEITVLSNKNINTQQDWYT